MESINGDMGPKILRGSSRKRKYIDDLNEEVIKIIEPPKKPHLPTKSPSDQNQINKLKKINNKYKNGICQINNECFVPKDINMNNRKPSLKRTYYEIPKEPRKFVAATRRKELQELTRAGGFSLGKKIGSGAHSVVHLVNHNGGTFACKIIDKEKCPKKYVMKFVPRELEITRLVSHPHIIKLFKVMDVNNFILYFFEYCELGDLADYISEEGPLPEPMARHFFNQILSAVEYLHSLKIAHRDIKCENIFITLGLDAKLGDFGLSKFCKSRLSESFCGSFDYIAPEITQQNRYAPLQADLWALGCLLFIMISGVLPFTNRRKGKFLDKQLGCKLNLQVKNEVSPSAMQVITSFLKPVPEERIPVTQVTTLPWFNAPY